MMRMNSQNILFFQLNELYEEKVKKLRSNSIKKSAEVLENRNQLKIQLNLLNDTFRNLFIEEANLQKRKSNIIEIQNQIEEMQEIKNFEDQQIQKGKDIGKRQKQRYLEEFEQKKNDKSNLEKQINKLNYHKDILAEEKNRNIQEQNEIKEKIKSANNQIISIIIKLKNISQKIEDIAMNNNHQKIEDEYFDSLMDIMGDIGLTNEEEKRNLKNIKENIRNFKEVIQLKKGDFMNV